ncbi:MAG: class I SAM-dependent methyltransferase [Stackebrandtia sp.]
MDDRDDALAYWKGAGATKTFTHPVSTDWLAGVGRDVRVLDYGCGYGRIMAELDGHGFTDLTGVDPSPALVARGRGLRPELRFDIMDSPPATGHAAAGFGLVMLFAVLCVVPADRDQLALVAELDRVLAPGGLLYVSDMALQADERNRSRYDAHARNAGTPYGVFTADDGATFRHHDIDVLRDRFAGFEPVAERQLEVGTLNGHRASAVQFLLRKPE